LTDPRTQPRNRRRRNVWLRLLFVVVGALAIACTIAAYRDDDFYLAAVLLLIAAVMLLVHATFVVVQVVTLLSFKGAWRVWSALPGLVVGAVFGWGLILGKGVGQLFAELILPSWMGLHALGVLWAARATLGKADQGPRTP